MGRARSKEFEVEPLLDHAQVAALFHIDPKTLDRWITDGKLEAAGVTVIRLPSRQRRYREREVRAVLRPEVRRSQAS